MQVSAVGNSLNNISFKSARVYDSYSDYLDKHGEDDFIEGTYREIGKDDAMNQLVVASKNVSDTAYKTAQDVSPITIIASLVAAGGTIAAVKGKAMPVTRKVIATVGEEISKAVVSLVGSIKKISTENMTKATDKIENFADAIRSEEASEGMLKAVKGWATKISSEEKAEEFIETLKKQNITNPGQVFDFAVGLAAAWKIADGTSDVVEGGIDDAKVGAAIGQLKALAGSLGLDFTDDQINALLSKRLHQSKAA